MGYLSGATLAKDFPSLEKMPKLENKILLLECVTFEFRLISQTGQKTK
jgi:hypothetical protein